MPLKTPKFVVHLQDGRELPATIEWADQLRAEVDGTRLGITHDTPLHLTTLWCWASLHRTKDYDGAFPAFRAELRGIERVRTADDPDGEGEPVDPTPGPSSPPLSSPPPTAAAPTTG